LVANVQQWEQPRRPEMKNDNRNSGENAKKFRDYAAECRRLAQRASEKDRKVLMEIAEAWMTCAQDAERKASLQANPKANPSDKKD
jgi:hypothetical protein